MGRSGNPVLSEEQKKKLAMRGGGAAKRGGGRGGSRGGGGGRGGGSSGGGRGGGGGFGGPGGRGGFGGPGGPPGGRGEPPGFAQARYGFFTDGMPSGPIGHVNKQFVDSRMPVMTPSASSVGGGDRPIRPPNGRDEGSNWMPNGAQPLMSVGGGPGGPGGPPGPGPMGGLPMPPGYQANKGAGAGPKSAGQAGTIHELFGKMVWKKMEALEDPTEVDTLQNDIMDLIAKAVKRQQERKTKGEEERARNGGGESEAIPYGRPHAANNMEPPAFGRVAEFGGFKPYQGPGFF